MQTIMLSGNLASDCEIVRGKDGNEVMRFTVAVNDARTEGGEKATFYSCRMRKTKVSEFLKMGRFVSVVGTLKVTTNVKEDRTYVNLDVWVMSLGLTPGRD